MANAPINIVYPIDGGTYPRQNPAAGPLNSAYITASFGLTLGGGPAKVTWGFDRTQLGKAKFYDQYTTQQVWKLAGGRHRFWVKAEKGGSTFSDSVKFKVGA